MGWGVITHGGNFVCGSWVDIYFAEMQFANLFFNSLFFFNIEEVVNIVSVCINFLFKYCLLRFGGV